MGALGVGVAMPVWDWMWMWMAIAFWVLSWLQGSRVELESVGGGINHDVTKHHHAC